MAFTDINFAFGAKLTSTQLNQLQGNFDAIAQGDSSEFNLFGQALKACYFDAEGRMIEFQSVGVSSVVYASIGPYTVNWTNSYTTLNYCANFQMEKIGSEESRNFQLACQSKSGGSITVYARASDPGDTDPINAKTAVVMAWGTDGI
jgi:hypothetical protein